MSKEFKAGDKVRVLVDAPRGQFLKGCIYEVYSVCEEVGGKRIMVVADYNGNLNGWLADNFELVESFDDLIDVAVKAWKDGHLKVLEFESGAAEQIFTVIGENAYRWHEGDGDYNHAVGLINSLYTETFVIENEEDIVKVNIKDDSAKIILANKTELELSGSQDSSNQDGFALGLLLPNGCVVYYGISVLRGATITQKKDIK